jgi:drug/metabolite transporter (DMT)-like permease
MNRHRTGLRDRLRGAGAAGFFGAVVAGPQELLGSGAGGDFLLALSVGAATGAAVGFAFPSVLTRRRRERPTVPPPPHPPPPPPERRA